MIQLRYEIGAAAVCGRRLQVKVIGECGCEALRALLVDVGGGRGHALEAQLFTECVSIGAAVVGPLVALRHRRLHHQC